MRNAYAVRRPVVNPYLVRERDRRRHRELATVLLISLSVGACLIAYVWLHVELLRVGYRVHRLEERLEAGQRQQKLLELEASYQSSPSLIEERAVTELGLQKPDLSQVVFEREIR
jgi:cell division protein FtsL